ncbi:MAG: SDR family oxidoreductase [Candidatus Obscuribacterales bacterium]|nr:SDR family oxidoreductase [Candidatus Obscuribacterales bacterium]
MRVFITGGSGFIGTALTTELINSGHQVLALARTDESAAKLRKLGAQIQMGSLEDLDSLRKGAAAADGVIHLGFVHGLSQVGLVKRLGIIFGGITRGIMLSFGETVVGVDIKAIEAIGSQLEGTNRPFVNVLGTMSLKHGKLGTEKDALDASGLGGIRSKSERAMFALVPKGVSAMCVCLPPTVHGDGDKAFVPHMIKAAEKHRASAYINDGQNRWPAVHLLDAVRLIRLVLENGKSTTRYHGVAEEGIPLKNIADVIGRKLNLPVVSKSSKEAEKHFGFLTAFFSADNLASSQWTQEQLSWKPIQPGLIADLEKGTYFKT